MMKDEITASLDNDSPEHQVEPGNIVKEVGVTLANDKVIPLPPFEDDDSMPPEHIITG